MPVAGGLNDQDPELLDRWLVIISEKAQHDKSERDKQGGKGKGGTLGAGKNVRGPKVAGRMNN